MPNCHVCGRPCDVTRVIMPGTDAGEYLDLDCRRALCQRHFAKVCRAVGDVETYRDEHGLHGPRPNTVARISRGRYR